MYICVCVCIQSNLPIKTTIGTFQNGLYGQVVLVSSLVSCIYVYVVFW